MQLQTGLSPLELKILRFLFFPFWYLSVLAPTNADLRDIKLGNLSDNAEAPQKYQDF